MTREDLEAYIHANLPLTKAMGVYVVDCAGPGIRLGAPLKLNLNHKRTAFGGSLESIATVACWSALYVDLLRRGLKAEIVIHRCEMSFERPVEDDFMAVATFPTSEAYRLFERLYQRRGIARMNMASQVESGGQVCAQFKGEFAAVRLP